MGRLLILEAIDGARVPTIKGTGNIDLVASCWFTAFDGIGKPNALLHFGFAVNDGSDTQGSWTWSSFHGELPGPDISFVTAVAGDSNVQVQNDDTSIHTTVVAEAFDAGRLHHERDGGTRHAAGTSRLNWRTATRRRWSSPRCRAQPGTTA